MANDSFMDFTAIADRIGVKVTAVRTYHKKATDNRLHGDERVGDLPPPDQHFGRTPVWKTSTIEEWIERRPGHGFRLPPNLPPSSPFVTVPGTGRPQP